MRRIRQQASNDVTDFRPQKLFPHIEVLRLSRISAHVTTRERATIFNKSWIIDKARGDSAGHFIMTPLIAIVKSRLFG